MKGKMYIMGSFSGFKHMISESNTWVMDAMPTEPCDTADTDCISDEEECQEDEVCDQAPVAVTGGYQKPADNFGASSFKRPEWCVVKCMTDNGIRIGVDLSSETDAEIVKCDMSYEEALACADKCSQECDIPLFDSVNDKYLGKIASAVIKRDKPSGTSYDYTK
jgi:hypothetical protein